MAHAHTLHYGEEGELRARVLNRISTENDGTSAAHSPTATAQWTRDTVMVRGREV